MTKRRKDTDYLFLSARIRSLERNLLTAQRLEQLLQAPSAENCSQLLSDLGYDPIRDEATLQASLKKQREDVFAELSLERNLLTAQRLEQLLQAPSAENCSQLLSDLGYDPIRDEATLQASLKKQREDVFAELERFMPEKELLDVFRIKYDYHNIKVLLKAPESAERLLMDAGTIPAGDLQRQYADGGSWQFLPGDMAAAAEKAAQLLAETGSAQRSDCVLDRACFAQLEKLAADSRCDYLRRYVRAMIDAANLRSLVRAERLHMDPGFLQEVLFEGGSVPVDTLRAGVGNGVAALFRSTALREAAEEGEAAVKGGSLTAFEKACDNAVLKTAAGARQVPFGVEVALGYLIAKEAEWTAVRIVMAGRLAGLSADAIRERLRDAYV